MAKHYRILEDGEQYWVGVANDIDHALEKCYDDEGPGVAILLTVEEYATVRFSSQIKGKGWKKRWEGHMSLAGDIWDKQ